MTRNDPNGRKMNPAEPSQLGAHFPRSEPRASGEAHEVPRSGPKASGEVHEAAFTLLEVLAAVAILGLAYITLGSSGIQGLQHEGEARRKLQASLLADGALAEIEEGVEDGTVPPIGRDERQSDEFTIAVDVEPFTLDVPDESADTGKRLGHARSRLGGTPAAAQQPAIPGPSLLGPGSGPGAVSPLRKIDVRIVWTEGFSERSVARTTFALDPDAAKPTIDAIAQTQAAAQGQQPTGAPAANPLGGGRSGSIGTPR